MGQKVHVKKDDKVYILTGKEAGKSGKVLQVDRAKGRVIVEGVNLVKKHKKPRSRTQTGGIVEMEASIDASNVMLVCPHCKRPAKTGTRVLESGARERFCKACSATVSTTGGKAKKN